MPDHHNYRLDKDTPENIRQLLEQDTDPAPRSQHGLPAGDRLDNYQEPEPENTDPETLQEADSRIQIFGKGVDRPNPNFHGADMD